MHVLTVVAAMVLATLAGCLVGERPTEPDADGDSLPDSLEESGWNITVSGSLATCFTGEATPAPTLRHVRTKSLASDTDADGLSDGEEFLLQSDPNSTDTDGDGVNDKRESELRNGESFIFGLRLLLHRADSDGDCLGDAEEIDGFEIPGIGTRTTDPTWVDTDGDGLDDPTEVRRSRTDPRLADTDGDLANDRFDVDPLHDIWANLTFERFQLKARTASNKEPVKAALFWYVPSNKTRQESRVPTFDASLGQTIHLPARLSPGRFDLNDEQGTGYPQFEFFVAESETGIIDTNPHAPGQEVVLQLDVKNHTWAFQTGAEPTEWTEFGRQTVLDTPSARLEFSLTVHGPPGS